MLLDIKEFVEAKKNKVIKFDAKSSPFSVMIVAHFGEEILVEYQIKIKAGDDDESARLTNDFNHMLYELERSDTIQNLINALTYRIIDLRSKSKGN